MAASAPCAASVFAFTLLPVADTAARVCSCLLCGPRKHPSETISRYSCGLPITACRVIAEACGVSKRTIHRWIRFHGLPVFHLPGGALCTTLTFLNDWARDRMEVSSGRRPFFHTRGTVSVVWQKASRNAYVLGASFSVPPCQ
jgi:hypothetical protein